MPHLHRSLPVVRHFITTKSAMTNKIAFTAVFALISALSFGQTFDSLKLKDTEVPLGYSKSSEMLCATPHGCSFYDQTDLYESFLGKITKKEFQSFDKKGDQGTILYFEFEKEFQGQGFLSGLLWGQNKRPTKSEPDDFYSKGNILIIWSFNFKSELKQISKTKVTKLLP
jgi:hypothetical protein